MASRMTDIFVLTGAGVSAESGLGTFRDLDGLWTRVDLMKVATPEGYEEDRARVLDFYNARRRNALTAAPNPAHAALAQLGAAFAGRAEDRFYLCTQNVDDLHERAGSPQVTHMHGEIFRARCDRCGAGREQRSDILLDEGCLTCGAPAVMRPDVVWFGEEPLHMDEISQRLMEADLFVAIGTSATVYPAAGFVALARRHGAETLEINLDRSDAHDQFDEGRYGPASETVPAWVREVLG